jgi:putative heme-binding domain-containing protein
MNTAHLLLVRALTLTLFLSSGLALLPEAAAQSVNPLQSDVRAIRAGEALFRAQCATCHGADAKGIESIDAPDLTLLWTRPGSTDATVFQTIRNGIPGSIMPAHGFPDTELWMLVSYLRSAGVAGSGELPPGDALAGAIAFNDNCARCHRVAGRGGSLGPDLSGITARRSQEALRASVRDPNALIGRGYKPVNVVTNDNQLILGTVKSEDAFTLQIMNSNQQLQAFAKSNLRQISRDISDRELVDILHFLQPDRRN